MQLYGRVCIIVIILLMAPAWLFAGDIGGIIRSGPTVSATQPNWRLGITFDYAFDKAAFGVGVEMMVSTKPYEADNGSDLRLTVLGFFAECRYFVMQDDLWKLSAGTTVGARTVKYENASNNSFNPTDWVPAVPDSPLGSTMHFVLGPFAQAEYSAFTRLALVGRLGYDLHIGPDYIDVTATSLSGPTVQLGIRVPIS